MNTKALITKSGLRRCDIAKLLGLSRAAITNYAKGTRQPALEIAERLALLTRTTLSVKNGQVEFRSKGVRT